MANKIVTFVIDTLEPKLDSAIAAFVNELQDLGHDLKQIRVADDSGEALVPPNTVEGVNPPTEETPEPTPEPTPETPVDAPVDPTPVTADPSGTSSSTDTPPAES